MSLCSWLCRPLIRRVELLEGKLAQLENQLATLQSSGVMALNPYINLDTTDLPTIVFTGVNVQIVNGIGNTDSINGLGNLIVGYNAPRGGVVEHCSVGTATVQSDDGPASYPELCENSDDPGRPGEKGIISNNQKTGSHNLVVGDSHMYSQYGGVVFGFANIINMPWATVTGGSNNTAAGEAASVSGGTFNLAGGHGSRVNGHSGASVSGGRHNWAYGMASSISGGMSNKTDNSFACISGGEGNRATGEMSHVSGGGSHPGGPPSPNVASGKNSSILGGEGQNANLANQTIPPIP